MLPAGSTCTRMPELSIHAPTFACTSRIGGERNVRVMMPGSSEQLAIRRHHVTTSVAFAAAMSGTAVRAVAEGRQQQRYVVTRRRIGDTEPDDDVAQDRRRCDVRAAVREVGAGVESQLVDGDGDLVTGQKR